MQEFPAVLNQPKGKMLPFAWPGSLNLAKFNPIPHKYRPSRRLRNLQKIKSNNGPHLDNVARLQTSFNALESLKALRQRKWQIYDLQYVLLFGFIIFSLCILPPAPLVKTGALVSIGVLLLMPITQQFFLPSLPIWTYLLYFFSSRFIAPEYRPHIWVKVLPALENVLYGANLSNILSAHVHPILDILAWLPYGIGHFAAPAVCSAVLFLFAAPGTTPVFARAFGYMCLLGVTIQLIFPCTPPWYEKAHGLEPAHYGMEGSPAGLARIDELFGADMYTTSFTTAPVPFGAFPSLHAGNAVVEALFMQYCFPRFRTFFILYVGWIWWATMYLNHHYAIDLVGGALIAAVAYYISRVRWLPRPQVDKSTRWEYEYVEFGDRTKMGDEEYGYGYGNSNAYGLGLLERRGIDGDSDEWTLGSSSSFESMSRGETVSGSSASSPGILSPTTPDEELRHHSIIGLMPQGEMWNGERVALESELSEVVVVR
ncbi:hypothetical protein B0T25DRAFT_461311 [Lasiosphaeria hispida]|uniref:Phosphatidic acid phosphatase type 2/haloperoxidase domain-containing protein n=1 Tax=Lasiosphaeria hispida TaxID=260671 RepID=A0AAJ0MB41_9PEZI|nr:hypothetical protein B0T25DRAFT_461311 [Lasiosphaeria hispida]